MHDIKKTAGNFLIYTILIYYKVLKFIKIANENLLKSLNKLLCDKLFM